MYKWFSSCCRVWQPPIHVCLYVTCWYFCMLMTFLFLYHHHLYLGEDSIPLETTHFLVTFNHFFSLAWVFSNDQSGSKSESTKRKRLGRRWGLPKKPRVFVREKTTTHQSHLAMFFCVAVTVWSRISRAAQAMFAWGHPVCTRGFVDGGRLSPYRRCTPPWSWASPAMVLTHINQSLNRTQSHGFLNGESPRTKKVLCKDSTSQKLKISNCTQMLLIYIVYVY